MLNAGTYSIELSDFYNMSYLESNSVYTAGGGKGGSLNRVDLYGVRVLSWNRATMPSRRHKRKLNGRGG